MTDDSPDQAPGTGGPAIVSKGEYARLKGVTPGAVSHWIRAGRIDGPALQGFGRSAKIVVAIADRQLRERLDPGQQLGNGKATHTPTAPVSAPPDAAAPAQPVPLPAGTDAQARIQHARAEQAELDLERARRRHAAEQGRYMETDPARTAWSCELAELLHGIERWLPELAERLAAERTTDARALTLALSREWRRFRGERARMMQSRADGADALVAPTNPETADD